MSAGILDQVSYAKESVVGTAVTPTTSVAVLPCDGIVIEQAAVGVEGINTQPGLNKDFVPGKREYKASFAMNAYPNALGAFLKSALGGCVDSTAAGESTVYDHTYTESTTKTSYTVEQKTGDLTNRFAGFIASGFSIELKSGESIKLTIPGLAMNHASATAITASYETTKVFDWSDLSSLTIGGVEVSSVIDSLKIDYTNGLKSYHGIGATTPTELYIENSEVSGSIEGYLSSNMITLLTAFTNKTESEMVITLEGDETIGSSSHNKLIITIPKMVLNTYSVPIDTGYVKIKSDFMGAVDPTDGMISAVLTNAVASY